MSVGALILTTLRLAVPLYLSTVVLGLLPTTVAMLGLVPLAGDRPWRADLLGTGWMNVAAEMMMGALYTRDASGVLPMMAAGLLVLPMALLGQVVAYSFLAGGILETLHRATPYEEGLRAGAGPRPSFWAACRRWFWPFLRLSLLGGVLVVVAGLLGAVLSRLVRPLIGPDIAALVQYALQAVVLGWLEVARALMVMLGTRSVGHALNRASRLAVQPLVLVIWLALALPGAALLLAALLPPGIADPYAPVGLVQALAFGQILAFVGAWTKVARLAVALRLGARVGPAGGDRAPISRVAAASVQSEFS